ncbi:MAG: nuclear pore complex subunit [Flammeovirgaceae bacterium]|nr:nuclear pore complex subunit [Flammeovirgaceae bacterium]MBR06725.1 nuclear pore complex subunit [Rickettsiales bacterium]|tara:strand:+ start:307 stop:693 length:387 start_codon:yes stop_codon:yes gene_type:complete
MEKFFIEPTRVTPLVNFDPEEGILEVKGRSSPENSILFYQKIIDSLDEFAESGGDEFTANFSFEYFNTSSSKCLFDVFKKLSKINDEGKELTINWFYEEDDEDMMEAGEDYADLLDLDFNFREIEEFD